jgi:FtsZ-binding cell division protein ZapB
LVTTLQKEIEELKEETWPRGEEEIVKKRRKDRENNLGTRSE